jgi:hypothetical protein
MRATARMSRVSRRNTDQYPSTSTRCFARDTVQIEIGDVDLRRALAAQNTGEHQRLTGRRAPSSRQLPVQRRRRDAEAVRHLFQDRLLRREYGVRLRRSGRSEQDDPSINDHARGRLARGRTTISRFSQRVFQDHAQASSPDMGTPKRKTTPLLATLSAAVPTGPSPPPSHSPGGTSSTFRSP